MTEYVIKWAEDTAPSSHPNGRYEAVPVSLTSSIDGIYREGHWDTWAESADVSFTAALDAIGAEYEAVR